MQQTAQEDPMNRRQRRAQRIKQEAALQSGNAAPLRGVAIPGTGRPKGGQNGKRKRKKKRNE